MFKFGRVLVALVLAGSLYLSPTLVEAQTSNNTKDRSTTNEDRGQLVIPALVIPAMDSRRGRKLFAEKGCAVCHSVNGVGGILGPPLDEANMPEPMDIFGFVARMWRGAASMALMQEEVFGDVIDLSGQDLVDLVAFAHDENEQKKLTPDQIPEKLRNILAQ